MTVCAALVWWDEPLGFLDRCVRSLDGVADVLVAVDGPWEGFPHSRISSERDQVETIENAAAAVGLQLHVSGRVIAPWQSQVEKRDHLMRTAGELADWVLVIDGDEHIAEPRAEETRALLNTAAEPVGTVVCHHVTGGAADRFSAPIRRFYRAGTTVSTAHNGYLYDGLWLHGDPSYVRLAEPFATPLVLHHERSSRGDRRNTAALEYRAHRRRYRSEAWQLERGSTR